MGLDVRGKYAMVPSRCFDIGGWTDTHFSKRGKVFNFSVFSRLYGKEDAPFTGIEVIAGHDRLLGDNISIRASDPAYNVLVPIEEIKKPKQTNVLLATLHLIDKLQPIKKGLALIIVSPIPPGASLGTSATVEVAIIKALMDKKTMGKDHRMTYALTALKAETEIMGGESGTQDQFAASYAYGANFIEIDGYPLTTCEPVLISEKPRKKLEEGLITVFYGKHNSSSIHKKVIAELKDEGPDSVRLEVFRNLAVRAKAAVLRGDLRELGKIANENTEAQKNLAKGLVSERAKSIGRLADKCGAYGWKVNGAGGEGGSITALFPRKNMAKAFYDDCRAIYPHECGHEYFEHILSRK